MSYYQIYNEQIRDLLIRDNPNPMEICEDPVKGTIISNLAQVAITNQHEISDLLQLGNTNRIVNQTDKNDKSSRSHACLHLYITNNEDHHAKLTMIDLAGSERITSSQVTNLQLQKEGSCINKSLLALGNCISGLVRLQNL